MAKRAASAYWLWFEENRKPIIEQYGLEGKNASEVSKKAGQLWKAMDAASKKKYEDLATKDKERYEEEVQIVGKRMRLSNVDAGPGKKAQRDPYAPKQPLSAYLMWMQDCRENVKKAKAGHRTVKDFSYEAWKSVSEAIQKSYEDKAALARQQYKNDLNAYHLRRASCQGSLQFIYNERIRNSDNCERKDIGICDCGEPFNAAMFCENCGEENPNHPEATMAKMQPLNSNAIENGQELDMTVPNAQNDKFDDMESCEMVEGCDQIAGLATKEQVLQLARSLPKHEIQWLCEQMADVTGSCVNKWQAW